jgi:hypothetical protein
MELTFVLSITTGFCNFNSSSIGIEHFIEFFTVETFAFRFVNCRRTVRRRRQFGGWGEDPIASAEWPA